MTDISIIVFFGFLTISFIIALLVRRKGDVSELLVSGRSLGSTTIGMSAAASWIWAPALFVSSQKAYEQGLAGAFWFTLPNIAALLLFIPIAVKVKERFPDGFTLPEFMRIRYGNKVHKLYLLQFAVVQLFSLAVQLMAGASLLQLMTGFDYHFIVFSLIAITLS